MALPAPTRPVEIKTLARTAVPQTHHTFWRDLASDLLAQLMTKPSEARCLTYADGHQAKTAYDGLRRIVHRHPVDLPLIVRRDDVDIYVMVDEIRARALVAVQQKAITEMRKGA